MSWGPSKKRLAQFAVLAFMAGEFSYAAAEILILRSLGPSARNHPAGRRVADNTRFTLRPGDSVVILAGGATRTFRGPGTFTASGPVGGGGFAAAAGARRNTGAVRGPGDVEVRRPTDVWQFDVTQSGRVCVPAGHRPTLWRPSGDRAVRLTITPQTGTPQTIDWARGQSTLTWPSAIPLVDGASYQLNWTGGTGPTRLTARAIPNLSVGNVEAVATALVTNQCRGQLDVLIATREAASSADAAGGGTTSLSASR